jgi:hypothetical protein
MLIYSEKKRNKEVSYSCSCESQDTSQPDDLTPKDVVKLIIDSLVVESPINASVPNKINNNEALPSDSQV